VPLLLARVDDRLIHGQVAHGWGRALRPTLMAIVSDALHARPDEGELYLLAAPEGCEACVVSVEEAAGPAFRTRVEGARTILLFPGTEEPLRLVEAGFPLPELNLGGLHTAPGKREVLPWVWLDEVDVARLRRLGALGTRIEARDLPTNPPRRLEGVLDRATS
jgi:mannose/fructose/N-acetylgalactosamine-specific phosphotransferase system component IIB